MAESNKIVLLHGFKGVYKDFNGQIGHTTGIASKDNMLKIIFRNGIRVPSFTLGEVMWVSLPVSNTKLITRKAIISPEKQLSTTKSKSRANRKK